MALDPEIHCDIVNEVKNNYVSWFMSPSNMNYTLNLLFLTLVVCGIPILNTKVIYVQLDIHKWQDELLLDQVPNDPVNKHRYS